MPDVRSTLLGVGAVASATLALYAWPRKNELPLPKSPKAYPLIGNLLSMPQTREHLGFIELGKQLNTNVFSLSMFGIVIVVLNSVDDAINLLDKRSGIYSDRTVPPMIADPALMHWPDFLSLLRYGDGWRKTRRLIHPWLHKKASESFHESQQLEARRLLQRLVQRSKSLHDSEELYGEFFKTLAGTLMRSVYGYGLQSVDDPMLVGIQHSIENLAKAALPSNFLVNVFPALRYVPEWFPGAGWKKTAREWRTQQQKAVSDAYNWTKSRLESDPMPCIVASLIPHAEQLGLAAKEVDEYVSQIAVGLFGAGTETTANLLLVFAAAMVLYPEAQAKAQREIDAAIGKDRLPTVEDKSELQYTNCLIQEVMRWCPVVPNGVPHTSFQDDIYQGFRIPKGALVISNIWAMSRDERVYEDPETFSPDRFLDPSVPPCPVFGFGRRQCPGIHFAQTSAFIVIASILATFTITAAEEGPKPELRTDDSTVFHLKPFKFNITPRSPQHVDLINTGA